RRRFIGETAGLGIAAGVLSRLVDAQAVVPRRAIPTTGEELPIIALGTYRTFNVGSSSAELEPLRAVTQRFFELGGRIVDSSPQYGPSEAVFGDVLRQISGVPRDMFVATKVATEGREAGIRQMEESPEKMGVDSIDLMQIHSIRDWRTHLPTLRAWKEQGRARYIGISASREVLYEDFVAIMRNEPLDFVQINYSVAERASEEIILPLAMERRMAVLINRPFVAGALFPYVVERSLPEWAAEFDCQSWAQFFLKYVLAHPAVTAVIQATTDVGHLVDNMGAAYGRMPDDATRQRMTDLIGLTGRPPWD
ncbi:MAG: aldo/keto reductase, partial [Gammaproteobacteria bacterium]|nr:aldo/keto reductase [Gammaproteobacteria bacterium]